MALYHFALLDPSGNVMGVQTLDGVAMPSIPSDKQVITENQAQELGQRDLSVRIPGNTLDQQIDP